jgi:hypothetical protein
LGYLIAEEFYDAPKLSALGRVPAVGRDAGAVCHGQGLPMGIDG